MLIQMLTKVAIRILPHSDFFISKPILSLRPLIGLIILGVRIPVVGLLWKFNEELRGRSPWSGTAARAGRNKSRPVKSAPLEDF